MTYEHLGFKLVNGKLVNLEPKVVYLDEFPFHPIGSHVTIIKPYYNDGRHGIITELLFNGDFTGEEIKVIDVKYRVKYDDDMFPLVGGVWEHGDLEIVP